MDLNRESVKYMAQDVWFSKDLSVGGREVEWQGAGCTHHLGVNLSLMWFLN